jgi:hypothetical protein
MEEKHRKQNVRHIVVSGVWKLKDQRAALPKTKADKNDRPSTEI